MMRVGGWTVIAFCAFSALAACGGRAQPPSGSGDPSASGGAQAEPDAGSDAGDLASEAGVQGYTSLIHSGTRTCQNDDYCFGLACYAPLDFAPTMCLARCATDLDCLSSESCVQSAKLDPTCYARCDSPSDCLQGFDCFDFSGAGEFVCFPAGWAGRRNELD